MLFLRFFNGNEQGLVKLFQMNESHIKNGGFSTWSPPTGYHILILGKTYWGISSQVLIWIQTFSVWEPSICEYVWDPSVPRERQPCSGALLGGDTNGTQETKEHPVGLRQIRTGISADLKHKVWKLNISS